MLQLTHINHVSVPNKEAEAKTAVSSLVAPNGSALATIWAFDYYVLLKGMWQDQTDLAGIWVNTLSQTRWHLECARTLLFLQEQKKKEKKKKGQREEENPCKLRWRDIST